METVERSILKLPLSKVCAVTLALQNRALLEGGRKGQKDADKRRGRGVANKGGKKENRTRENRLVKQLQVASELSKCNSSSSGHLHATDHSALSTLLSSASSSQPPFLSTVGASFW